MASPVQITGGGFQDSTGAPLNGGTVRIKLSKDALCGTVQLSAGIVAKVPLDTNGNVSGTVSLWPTDQMNPTDAVYIVSAYSAKGQKVWGPWQETLASGVSFDIGGWIPNNPDNSN